MGPLSGLMVPMRMMMSSRDPAHWRGPPRVRPVTSSIHHHFTTFKNRLIPLLQQQRTICLLGITETGQTSLVLHHRMCRQTQVWLIFLMYVHIKNIDLLPSSVYSLC